MNSRNLILNLIPDGVMPVLKLNQYDKGMTVMCEVWDGSSAYSVPSNAGAIVQGTKPDKTGYQYSCTMSGGNVYFTVADQMTVIAGRHEAEITIVIGSIQVGTINFVVDVEPAALRDDTIISETTLPLIEEATQAAAEIAKDIPTVLEAAETAKTKASEAATSATAAASSATKAANSATAAAKSETNAKTSEDNAKTSETNAKASETAAAGSASDAAASASDAADSATAAAGSASDASDSADAAASSASDALDSSHDSEAWAIGKRDGTDVPATDETYHNNAKYYSEYSADRAAAALTSENNAKDSEDAAKDSEDAAHASEVAAATSEANALQYADDAHQGADNATASATQAAASAHNAAISEQNAADSESNASDSASDAEAWAVGQRDGADVSTSDATYQNNSKYYAGLASASHDSTVGIYDDCVEVKDEIYNMLQMAEFDVNADGFLVYTDDSNFNFTVNNDGMLEWEVA